MTAPTRLSAEVTRRDREAAASFLEPHWGAMDHYRSWVHGTGPAPVSLRQAGAERLAAVVAQAREEGRREERAKWTACAACGDCLLVEQPRCERHKGRGEKRP